MLFFPIITWMGGLFLGLFGSAHWSVTTLILNPNLWTFFSSIPTSVIIGSIFFGVGLMFKKSRRVAVMDKMVSLGNWLYDIVDLTWTVVCAVCTLITNPIRKVWAWIYNPFPAGSLPYKIWNVLVHNHYRILLITFLVYMWYCFDKRKKRRDGRIQVLHWYESGASDGQRSEFTEAQLKVLRTEEGFGFESLDASDAGFFLTGGAVLCALTGIKISGDFIKIARDVYALKDAVIKAAKEFKTLYDAGDWFGMFEKVMSLVDQFLIVVACLAVVWWWMDYCLRNDKSFWPSFFSPKREYDAQKVSFVPGKGGIGSTNAPQGDSFLYGSKGNGDVDDVLDLSVKSEPKPTVEAIVKKAAAVQHNCNKHSPLTASSNTDQAKAKVRNYVDTDPDNEEWFDIAEEMERDLERKNYKEYTSREELEEAFRRHEVHWTDYEEWMRVFGDEEYQSKMTWKSFNDKVSKIKIPEHVKLAISKWMRDTKRKEINSADIVLLSKLLKRNLVDEKPPVEISLVKNVKASPVVYKKPAAPAKLPPPPTVKGKAISKPVDMKKVRARSKVAQTLSHTPDEETQVFDTLMNAESLEYCEALGTGTRHEISALVQAVLRIYALVDSKKKYLACAGDLGDCIVWNKHTHDKNPGVDLYVDVNKTAVKLQDVGGYSDDICIMSKLPNTKKWPVGKLPTGGAIMVVNYRGQSENPHIAASIVEGSNSYSVDSEDGDSGGVIFDATSKTVGGIHKGYHVVDGNRRVKDFVPVEKFVLDFRSKHKNSPAKN